MKEGAVGWTRTSNALGYTKPLGGRRTAGQLSRRRAMSWCVVERRLNDSLVVAQMLFARRHAAQAVSDECVEKAATPAAGETSLCPLLVHNDTERVSNRRRSNPSSFPCVDDATFSTRSRCEKLDGVPGGGLCSVGRVVAADGAKRSDSIYLQ